MEDKLEKLIRALYRKYKTASIDVAMGEHPDEEDMVCFLEDRLSADESERIKAHLFSCDSCAEAFSLQLGFLKEEAEKSVPGDLIDLAKGMIDKDSDALSLEIVLKLKEKIWELLRATGDVIVGQELVPAPVLRARQIRDFKDEITILKDIKDIRVEIKIETKGKDTFGMSVLLREKSTQRTLKDLRVTLLRDDLELESYLVDLGRVVFEHVLLGRYQIEILNVTDRIARILLDIRK